MAARNSRQRKRLCISLPRTPKSLYDEFGEMLLEALADSPYNAVLTADGDESALNADLLLMIGDCMEFKGYANLLGRSKVRPMTALWLLDTLPPATLSERAAKLGSRVGLYNKALHFMRSNMKSMVNFVPISVRRKMGVSTCAALLKGFEQEVTDEQLKALDTTSLYEVIGRFEWISRQMDNGWLGRIYTNTMPKKSFLDGAGIQSEFIPLGHHPRWGKEIDIERDIDVIFLGELAYGRRKPIVEYIQQELESRGINVTVVGGNCYGEERERLLNRAKISLNVPRFPWDIPTIRVFMSVGCGSMVISEEMGNTAPFESGKHLYQAGVKELPEKIAYYLQNDEAREEITRNAHELITQKLTLKNQVLKVLSACEGDKSLTVQKSA